jgi:hypothetical protein
MKDEGGSDGIGVAESEPFLFHPSAFILHPF